MTLEILTHDDLAPIKHGFFTRRGGASSGVFKGLNCGHGSSDQSDSVSINRARVAEAMGVAPSHLLSVHQCHSANVVVAETPIPQPLPKADAIVTATPGLALGILTADCQPVLFSDLDAGVIGAAHAGWKGAMAGVLEATIDSMETLGAARQNITAVVGPCISQATYEVGQEFFEMFMDEDTENSRFFAQGAEDRMQFDLPAYGVSRLCKAGVGAACWNRHCTYSDPDRFFSYRRSTHERAADYGRLISVIRL
ncbi:peptidoglycan editing factor PgeF [Cochlodiniinecator piscidefendens]|uniref:peptidoglycan editing factor PgeF n=1 Tax=Cochlodiniinecator piscidefendens TaxID=2715756 RepID=UPI0014092AB5|nr:peptidoglycan editing factor PgeF [Cochlodiniinecator piscidefendens]